MKRILLTTTSLVLAAGVAQADITWSGSATAGMARKGKIKEVASTITAKDLLTLDLDLKALDDNSDLDGKDAGGAALAAADAAEVRAAIVNAINAAQLAVNADSGNTTKAATLKNVQALLATFDGVNASTAAEATGKMTQYAEVNAAASASVATDMGWTVTMGASLDVGNGYDFADDDGFDGRTVGAVSLDTISIDFGAGGVLSLNDNGFAHLVDADDDAAADLKYTNTFGTAAFSLVADIDDGDSDTKASKATVTRTAANGKAGDVTYAAAVAADTQWSAKVSMPLAGTNVYFAADEAGGDAYGVSGTYAGIGWSVDSKREALAKDTGAKRSNTVGVSYATGALTLGASYDSIKDGDQWGVSAAYAAGALSLNVSTDEGDDWSASGAYDLGNGASLVGGTNYTEDAYVGVSFAF
ncbi:hypothetical protein N9E07_00225 [Planktomarina temperata]|nr:hypothetical protein [Planktomarina temperata]